MTLSSDSFAEVRMEYDKKGNIIKKSIFDKSEQLIQSLTKYCIIEYKYYKYGNITKSKCFRKSNGRNYIEFKYEYDSIQRISEICTLKNGKTLFANKNGYATTKLKYNELGEEIEKSYYDINNKLIKSFIKTKKSSVTDSDSTK